MLKKILSAVLCALMAFSLCTGCGSVNQKGTGSKTGDDFDVWADDLFKESITENTLDLHYTLEDPAAYGITDYPVTLGDCSQEAADESSKESEELLKELKEFNYDSLSEDQQITYDSLEEELELDVEAADYPYYYEPLSPTIGTQTNIPSLLAEYALNTKQDVEDYLGLLADVDRYYEDLLTYEQEKSRAGLFMSDKILDMTLDDLDSFIKDADDSYLIATFDERIENVPDLTENEKNEYREKNEALIQGEVVTAYKNLKSGMEALRGTGKNDGGLGNFKKGKDYYKYLIRSSVGSSKSVNKLEKMTQSQLEDDMQTFSDLYSEELWEELDSFSFTLTDPEEILADLQEKMLKDFPALETDVNVQIRKVSESLEDSSSPAYYLTAALDNLKDNVIYVNYGYLDESSLYSTLAHEGYPGHLYQTVYSGACTTQPLRRLLETTGYCEGWATYVENMAYYYDDTQDEDLLTAMQANNSMSLGFYALADFYINYEKVSKDEIQNWIEDYFTFDDDGFDEFYYLVLSQPANYLNYYIGYLEFLNLRDEAEEELGSDFDLKEFHTFILETGNAPFDVVESHMQSWISEQEKAA